jgi:hypothetical protein
VKVRRWPLHPRPLAGEVLSSWLTRIAAAYGLSTDDLLVHNLGYRSMSFEQLDLGPQDSLLERLSEKTGVNVERIRSMTIKGCLPPSIGGGVRNLGAESFARYVSRYSVLLSPGCRDTRQLNRWRPWITERRFASPFGCPRCLMTDTIPYRRLFWRLAFTASCPTHGILLESVVPVTNWKPEMNRCEMRKASRALCELDCITLQALDSGIAKLPHVSLPTDTWLQLLRTILDELNTTAATAQHEHRVLRAVWRAANLPVRVTASVSQPFEGLSFVRQAQFLHAAGEAIALLSTQRLTTLGRDAQLIAGVPAPQKKILVNKEAEPGSHWGRLAETADALLVAARATRQDARQLRKFLLFGKSDPDRVARVDRILDDMGIVVR